MAAPHLVQPVKFFIAVLFKEANSLGRAVDLITAQWGALDFQGTDHLFDCTDYYVPEMGAPLFRRLLSLHDLQSPAILVDMKLGCNTIESDMALAGQRTVNLDAGYLDHNKVILASAKEAGQKIYLDKGIYADLVGRYKSGIYQPFEWSFPDFKNQRYSAELLKIREIYRAQRKEWIATHEHVRSAEGRVIL